MTIFDNFGERTDIHESLVQTWAIHNRIHLYLLEALTEDALDASFTPKGRTVYGLFAHIHNVRRMWLTSAAPELLVGVEYLDKREGAAKEPLRSALTTSGTALETLLREALAGSGKIKGFKPHAAAFLGYLIAHESHHRGQIKWALRAAGQPLSDKVSYGLWEWGVR